MTTAIAANGAATSGPPGASAANLADIVRLRVDDPATGLRFEDEAWSWTEVVQEAADRAAWLDELAERPAARPLHVGMLLDNVPDFVFWIGACGLAGATVVGINTSRSAEELAADIRHADVDVIVTEERHLDLLSGDHGVSRSRVLVVDSPAYAAALGPHQGSAVPSGGADPDDIAFLMFSSGSTGRPKAVVLSHARLSRLTPVLSERISLRRDSITYLCMPLFHGNSVLMNLIPAFATGAQVAMARRFSASRFSRDIHDFGATYVNYVGRALSYVLDQPADERDALSSLELAFGTEASEADVERFAQRFGCGVIEGYGQSEGVFRLNRNESTPPGSLGVPPGGLDIRICSETTGAECPRAEFDAHGRLINPDAVGQIVAIGLAHTFEGYYKNAEAMADRVRGADYWSGDLGYRDAEGNFYFAGRSSDWLRVDSENFAAAQVERILQRHPAVAAAPVFGVPDPVTGDRVMCVVETHPGARIDPADFAAFLREQADMAVKWWPSFVRMTDSLPLTGSGKVDKAPLRRAAWCTDDVVWVRKARTWEFQLFDDRAREDLVAQFVAHGRTQYLPQEMPPPA